MNALELLEFYADPASGSWEAVGYRPYPLGAPTAKSTRARPSTPSRSTSCGLPTTSWSSAAAPAAASRRTCSPRRVHRCSFLTSRGPARRCRSQARSPGQRTHRVTDVDRERPAVPVMTGTPRAQSPRARTGTCTHVCDVGSNSLRPALAGKGDSMAEDEARRVDRAQCELGRSTRGLPILRRRGASRVALAEATTDAGLADAGSGRR